MPFVRLKTGNWEPDKGQMNHGSLWAVDGVIPINNAWVAAPPYLQESISSPSTYTMLNVYGLYLHPDQATSNGFWIVVGTNNRLLRSTAISDPTMQAATAGVIGTTPDRTSGWQFTSYGEQVWATNFAGHMFSTPVITTNFDNTGATGGVVFTTPDTYRPRARYITTIKNHTLIGNVAFDAAPSGTIPTSALTGTSYPSLVMWSATDNPRRFGDPLAITSPVVLGSDWQDIQDESGPITGLIGGDYAYIFKSRSIWRMDGPPFTFRPVVNGTGTIYPNSIVRFYDDIYFWGSAGPTRLRAGSSVPDNIGLGKVRRSLLDFYGLGPLDWMFELENHSLDAGVSSVFEPYQIFGWADYRAGLVCFACMYTNITSGGGSTFSRNTPVITYNVDEERFGFFKMSHVAGFFESMPRYASNPPSFTGGSPAGQAYQSYTLDGAYFITAASSSTSSTTRVATFVSDMVSSSDPFGDSLPALPSFIWPYLGFKDDEGNEVKARIIRVRPVVKAARNNLGAMFDITNPAGGNIPIGLNVSVTVRSKTRGSDNVHSASGSYHQSAPPDVDVSGSGWIFIDGIFADLHQIDISLATPNDPATSARRELSCIQDMMDVDIEYEIGGQVGTFYSATI